MITEDKPRILIVDDDADSLNVLLEMLSANGYRIFVSNNGIDAVEKAQSLAPDLILLDIMMPEINGFETCTRMKENDACRDIPVIFITALSEANNKVKGFEAGGVDYIVKPYQNEEVLSRVSTHLKLRKQQRELEILNADKDKFFSIIAHDLKSPISAFFSYIRLLDNIEDLNINDIKDLTKELKNSAKNLYNLLDNLLNWARIQRGLLEYSPQIVNIKQSVDSNFSLFMPLAANKTITLVNRIEEDINAFCDRNMLDTIVRNLITNAIKYTKPGGEIVFTAMVTDNEVKVNVSDNGIGIPDTTLAKLFRIDSKCHQSGTSGEGGTGLGLILSKDLIEKNNGKISIKSEEGKGTVVTFTLPVEKSAQLVPA